MRILRRLVVVILVLPATILAVLLAIANREPALLTLDPFGAPDPALAIRVPLFLLIFLTLIIGVILGGLASWLRQGRHRGQARRLRADLARREREIEDLRRRMTEAPAPAASRALVTRQAA